MGQSDICRVEANTGIGNQTHQRKPGFSCRGTGAVNVGGEIIDAALAGDIDVLRHAWSRYGTGPDKLGERVTWGSKYGKNARVLECVGCRAVWGGTMKYIPYGTAPTTSSVLQAASFSLRVSHGAGRRGTLEN